MPIITNRSVQVHLPGMYSRIWIILVLEGIKILSNSGKCNNCKRLANGKLIAIPETVKNI